MGRPIPMSLSPSKISAFKACPLAFRFSTIDKLPEPPSPPASKGTLVHRTLELLMLRPSRERTLDHALADLERARVETADDPEFVHLHFTPEEWREFHAAAEALVRRYFHLEDPSTIRPVGLEVLLSAQVDGVTIRGIIDRLELDPAGELVVTDYKTGAAPRHGFERPRLEGLQLYALLCEEVLRRLPVRIQLLYLSTAEVVAYEPDAASVRGVRQRAAAIWQAVQRACATDDFRPRPGPLCDFCNFRAYCPAFGGDPDRAVELRTGAVQERLPAFGG